MSINEVASELGVHVNTVRFHLDRLVATGQVHRDTVHQGGPGRPAALFAAVPGMDPAGPRHYELLAQAFAAGLAAAPDTADRALDTGLRWGHEIAGSSRAEGGDTSLEALVDVLDGLGFAPERLDDPEQPKIGLRHCPFLELAVLRSEVVCPIHLGVMRGALEAWDSPLTVDRLEPFVEPDLCMTHLSRRGTR